MDGRVAPPVEAVYRFWVIGVCMQIDARADDDVTPRYPPLIQCIHRPRNAFLEFGDGHSVMLQYDDGMFMFMLAG